jgi:hypothetical protein
VIINPGSENKGGTFEQALINAKQWHESILKEFPEVTMTEHENVQWGDWYFTFTHQVTKKEINLAIHGFTDKQCDSFIFHPRVYWNDSSTGNPCLEDWETEDFRHRIIYEKK